MNSIFVVSENIALASKLVQLANSLGQPVFAVATTDSDAASIAAYPVERVYVLRSGSARPEAHAQALADLVKREAASLLLVGDTSLGRELAAKTAAHLNVGLVSNALTVQQAGGHFETTRMMYGGAVIKTEALNRLTVITVAGHKLEASQPSDRQAPITVLDVEADTRVSVDESTPIVRQGSDLHSAEVVVGVGLGFDKQSDLALANELATVCKGAVGCTRPVAEDKKWLPVEQYIGISGLNIGPTIYFAVGISGQVQHLVGIRESKLIVAINKDDKAPIFGAADYGLVGDLYEILPLLTQALKNNHHVG